MQLGVKKLKDNAVVPKYQSDGASGFDLHATDDICLMGGEVHLIGTGLAFDIPSGYELQIRPRSGLSAKTFLRVANSPGTIDEDYSGEVKIIMHNTGTIPSVIKAGDRIAQAVLCPVIRADIVEVTTIKNTTRGSSGFGSTGVK
jgi:dUTP pyrophosphatase